MSLLCIKQEKSEDSVVVLVLQGEQAYWFKYRQDCIVDSFVDYIGSDAQLHATRCPWLLADAESKESELVIHLVLDTMMDELDHVTLDIDETNFVGDIKRFLSIRRLRKDYAQATVYPLPRHPVSQIASLLHHIIPESWSHWIVELQKEAVCIGSVVTATELLASWSQSIDTALLLNISAGVERRHLVVEAGKPLFLRVAPAGGYKDNPDTVAFTESEVAETLSQFNRSRNSTGVELPVVELYTNAPSPSVEWHDARTLSALRLGLELSVRHTGFKAHYPERDIPACRSSTDAMFCVGNKRTGWIQQLTGHFMAYTAAPENQWSPLRYAWSTMDALAESRRSLKLQACLNRLQVATMGIAFLGGLLVLAGFVQGISGADYRQMQGEQQQSNAIKTEKKMEEARSIHHSSDAVVRSIRLLNDAQTSDVARPEAIAATIASALSKAPKVILDRLIWSATVDSEPVDGLLASIDRATVRDQLPGADGVIEQVYVEVMGVVSGHDLSAQKHSLDEFVRALQENKVVSNIVVVESPVDSALNSQLVVEQSSQYRVSMIISTS